MSRDKNGRYRGEWDADLIKGNPAQSPRVENIVHALKNKFSAGGGNRTHSAAMSIDHMEMVYRYISKVCPSSGPNMSFAEKHLYVKCLEYLAFSTTAWNLWLR